jgi:toxin-antitoxin system PIN domain toxin
VIAVDTNILVYAHRAESTFHTRARASIRGLWEATDPWAIPWPCVHEFLATVTKRSMLPAPTPVMLATDQVKELMLSESLVLLGEGPGYFDRLARLLEDASVDGARIHDARIAAICLDHRVSEFWTADRDFASFPTLPTRNPLV